MSSPLPRTIETRFFNERHEIIKVIKSVYPNKAAVNCYRDMQDNVYGAQSAEVFDTIDYVVHAQFRRHRRGAFGGVDTTYARDPENYEKVRRSTAMLGL